MKTFTYSNTFDTADSLQGATATNSGSAGVADSAYDADSNKEWIFSSSGVTNSTGKLELNADLETGNRVTDFTFSGTVDFIGDVGGVDNQFTDGVSFSLGNPSTLGAAAEYGLSTGLSVMVSPYQDKIAIFWNGVEIGSIPATGLEPLGAATFSVSVGSSGNVTASFGNNVVNATIPSGQWTSTDQSGWDFVVAGRSGANTAEGYIDDMTVNANIVCFLAGTRIATPGGLRAVESLQPGDLVHTLDHGAQPLLWVGARKVPAFGRLAPIEFAPGIFGADSPLCLSRGHCLFVQDAGTDALFGPGGVLVRAGHLTGLPGVAKRSGGTARFHHLALARHELVLAEERWVESLLPGPQARNAQDAAELEQLFPSLTRGLAPYPAARHILRRAEVKRWLKWQAARGGLRQSPPGRLLQPSTRMRALAGSCGLSSVTTASHSCS